MEGQRLILMDGTILEDARAGYAEGFLWCYITGYSIQQVASMFFDDEKTGRIVFQYGEMEDEYAGFTQCITLMAGTDGLVSVCLKKAV